MFRHGESSLYADIAIAVVGIVIASAPLIVIGLFFAIAYGARVWLLGPWLMWRRTPVMRAEQVVSVSDAGITTELANAPPSVRVAPRRTAVPRAGYESHRRHALVAERHRLEAMPTPTGRSRARPWSSKAPPDTRSGSRPHSRRCDHPPRRRIRGCSWREGAAADRLAQPAIGDRPTRNGPWRAAADRFRRRARR
jgi:hypothetical protein